MGPEISCKKRREEGNSRKNQELLGVEELRDGSERVLKRKKSRKFKI